ncbi:putative inner membrane protein [Salmonella enterica subsp. enterica]|uniref:Putative inner membrane protein n=1 Tax=Salmonella enterica I TaxID=59201 RepID=A0A447PDS7_SALET|nr:putative inner membrane protein [Salmonella enterica subsp. enterica]
MTLLLVLLFVIPVALLVNSIVDGSGPLIHAVTGGDMTLPDLAWLNNIPLVGAKLYAGWHSLLDMGGSAIMAKVRPYIGTTTTWFVGQAAHIGRFMMHCALMLLFSAPALLARRTSGDGNTPFCLSVSRLNAAMRRFCWLPRRSAPWRLAWWSPRWYRRYLAASGWRFPACLTLPC